MPVTAADRSTGGGDAAPRDIIPWRRIFVGYGIVLIMLSILVLSYFGLSYRMRSPTGPVEIGYMAAILICMALVKPAGALHRRFLAHHAGLDDRLQWVAIGLLFLLSAGTIVFGLLTLTPNGGSW